MSRLLGTRVLRNRKWNEGRAILGGIAVRASGRRKIAWLVRTLMIWSVTIGLGGVPSRGQDALIERTGPPALDDLESDVNKDGVPDGWYNARDAVLKTEGGYVGPHFVRFACSKPGRPSRLSRAFGIDGQTHEAINLGLW